MITGYCISKICYLYNHRNWQFNHDKWLLNHQNWLFKQRIWFWNHHYWLFNHDNWLFNQQTDVFTRNIAGDYLLAGKSFITWGQWRSYQKWEIMVSPTSCTEGNTVPRDCGWSWAANGHPQGLHASDLWPQVCQRGTPKKDRRLKAHRIQKRHSKEAKRFTVFTVSPRSLYSNFS